MGGEDGGGFFDGAIRGSWRWLLSALTLSLETPPSLLKRAEIPGFCFISQKCTCISACAVAAAPARIRAPSGWLKRQDGRSRRRTGSYGA
jgi:hypothetical protein